MDNPRLKGAVERFANNLKIKESFDIQYQIFTNYLMLKQVFFEMNEEYPYESQLDINLLYGINFGKDNTMAVDGCFILHEKEIIHLGLEDEDISEKLNKIKDGILNIVVIQTKSGKLDPTDLSTLSDCITTSFAKQSEWSKFIDLRTKIDKLLLNAPKVKIRFSTFYITGKPIDKNMLSNSTFLVRQESLQLAMKNFFWIQNSDYVVVKYFDDSLVYATYEKHIENSSIFSKTVQLEEMSEEIDCGKHGKILFGAISFGELMKIIYDSESQKPRELYGYNVRDAIKKSPINDVIVDSIQKNSESFLLLNNGITIIVDRQERKGKRGIELENIRIVNGCQTSNAILNVCKNETKYNNSKVHVKIIETSKDEILLGNITYSSNNQNTVTIENLFAINPKIFELEKRYKEFHLINRNPNLTNTFFERRQGQFKNEQLDYIDMLAQSKAYCSIWLREPHTATMYKEEVLKKYQEQIDNNSAFIEKSIVAGFLWSSIYKYIPAKYDNARYHIYTVILLFEIEKDLKLKNILDLSQIEYERKTSVIDNNWLLKLKINLAKAVELAVTAITNNVKDFPASNKKGGIHYRKFYPVGILKIIYFDYKKLNVPN